MSKAEDIRWQVEDDMRTLTRAQEIQADKARMARVGQLAKKQIVTIQKVAKTLPTKSRVKRK